MKKINKSIYQNIFENYPYGLIIYIIIGGFCIVFLTLFFLPNSKELFILSILFPILAIFMFGSIFTSMYVEKEKIIFKSFFGRKKAFLLENLYKIDDWYGVKGTGFFFEKNIKIYFAGRPDLSQKKIEEYKRFVYWLSDYKKSLHPDSDGIKIGKLVM